MCGVYSIGVGDGLYGRWLLYYIVGLVVLVGFIMSGWEGVVWGYFLGFIPHFYWWGFCGDFWSGKVDISITACSSCIGKGIGAILIKAEVIRKNEAKLGNEIGDIEEIGIRRDK